MCMGSVMFVEFVEAAIGVGGICGEYSMGM